MIKINKIKDILLNLTGLVSLTYLAITTEDYENQEFYSTFIGIFVYRIITSKLEIKKMFPQMLLVCALVLLTIKSVKFLKNFISVLEYSNS